VESERRPPLDLPTGLEASLSLPDGMGVENYEQPEDPVRACGPRLAGFARSTAGLEDKCRRRSGDPRAARQMSSSAAIVFENIDRSSHMARRGSKIFGTLKDHRPRGPPLRHDLEHG